MKRTWLKRGLAAVLLGICCGREALAVNFSMDSWIVVLEPDQKKTSHVLTLKYEGAEMGRNPADPKSRSLQPVPVEISIHPRDIDINGIVKHDTSKVSPDFVIYPSQLILYPGDVQKVQIQWVSDKPLTKEIAYGMIAVQLPVNLENNQNGPQGVKAQLMVLTKYEGIVVVRPKNIKPKVVVDTVYSQVEPAGNTTMVVELQNKGTGLQVTKDMRFTLAPLDAKGQVMLQKRMAYNPALNPIQIRNALFAGQKRRITVPWPAGLPVGPVQVTPEFP